MSVCDPAVQHDLLEAAGHKYCWSCGMSFYHNRIEKEWDENYLKRKKKFKFRIFWKREQADNIRIFSLFHAWKDLKYGSYGFTILNFAFSYE